MIQFVTFIEKFLAENFNHDSKRKTVSHGSNQILEGCQRINELWRELDRSLTS